MKKTHLAADYRYDFILLGLTCVAREYKLAWSINRALQINLIKQDDIKIRFLNNSGLEISNYLHRSEYSSIRLLKNKSYATVSENSRLYLVPELKNIDYLVVIEDETGVHNIRETVSALSEIPVIDFVTQIDTAKLKSKENLIFD
jgi:hypothetical protein